MKKETILFVCICFIWVSCDTEYQFSGFSSRVDSKTQKKAAENVIKRLLKHKADVFDIIVGDIRNWTTDGFHISKTDNSFVRVYAPNAVSAVWGVHYYLRNYCNIHISWDGDQLYLPDELPSAEITIRSVEKYRYYQNPCASSYSYVWWDWKRWEREIDWMALNGINLALAFTAQEAIWQRVYDGFGLPSNDFTGPGFLAWYRMGNLKNFSHGLSNSWHKNRIILQHKILERMRELGITPVLPAFCGIVPASLQEIYPMLNITKMSKWNKFSEEYCCPSFLNPSDDLFPVIAQVFFREYINEFGTNNIYSCDVYNENTPPSEDPYYLTSISSGVFNAMQLADPLAVWLLQGWMFTHPFWNKETSEAFLKGVPIGKLIILDLQSDLKPQYERLDNYFGHSFIWCTLHNFGGQLGIYGHLSKINKGVIKGRTFKNSTMIGIGITPEGIDQNYIIYEFTLDYATRLEPANLTDWVSKYAMRRYGIYNEDLNEAWLILKDTAYNYHSTELYRETVRGIKKTELLGEHISKNIMTKLPSLKLNELTWYNKSRMFDVYQKFLVASDDNYIRSLELFKHDFIDVTRQTIQFAVSTLYFNIINAFTLKDNESFQNSAFLLLKILDELDIILQSGQKFLLGTWLEAALNCGSDSESRKHYSYDARNQITLWGPNGELRDYAAKQWSGLVSDYYKPRWAVFIEALNDTLINETHYDSATVKEKIFLTVEKPFVESFKSYPSKPIGDPVEVINKFNREWGPILYEIFSNRTSEDFLNSK